MVIVRVPCRLNHLVTVGGPAILDPSWRGRMRRGGGEDPWLCVSEFAQICLCRLENCDSWGSPVNSGMYLAMSALGQQQPVNIISGERLVSAISGQSKPDFLEQSVVVLRLGTHYLENVPVFYNFPVLIETENVDPRIVLVSRPFLVAV